MWCTHCFVLALLTVSCALAAASTSSMQVSPDHERKARLSRCSTKCQTAFVNQSSFTTDHCMGFVCTLLKAAFRCFQLQTPLGVCAKGSIGPLSDLTCVDCFCNGFSDICTSDDGWFQAQVQCSFSADDGAFEANRFSTNGIKEIREVSLNVRPLPASLSSPLYLSFPSEFLGDKRTAYRQSLVVNLSIHSLNNGPSQCQVMLELESGVSFHTKHKLRMVLPPVGQEPVEMEVPLTAGDFILDRYYFRKRASSVDVRKSLANIRMMRLILTCTQPHSLQLYSSTLNFATRNSSSDGPAQQPLQEVNYVERCSCPTNRIGTNCETCAEGYTTDPSFGGEFALCVRCFCSFHSTTCDPVSGACTNCTGNTMGRDCEQCIEGYDRAQPLTILPCDRCADGYWNSDDGVCIPCNCHPVGSLSSVCDKSSGVCECADGFAGDRCDACSVSSSGIFPNCQPCDECTTQWEDRILPLEEQVEATVEFIASLNFTNDTGVGEPGDISEFQALLDLVAEIRRVLNTSMIDSLTSDVNSTHSFIYLLLNQTQSLLQRAREVDNQIQSLESVSSDISEQLETIQVSLMQLEEEFLNITLTFEQEEFASINSSEYLEVARIALERSNTANRIIQENVTGLLNQTADTLDTYNLTLITSDFESNQIMLMQVLASITSRVEAFRSFIAESNQALCGAGNSTEINCTLECGGIACDTCGGNSCGGLYSQSLVALNTSQRAVLLAEEALSKIQAEVSALQAFLAEVELSRLSASEAESFANETREKAENLLTDLQLLTTQIEQTLNRSRIDPDRIGRLESMTLSLQHELLPEEFFDLLAQINSTIDAFFSQANVSEGDLRQRVEEALQRALRADELARMIVSNATLLEEQLLQLSRQQLEAEAVANDTEQLVEQAEEAIGEAILSLNDTENLVGSLGALLSTLNSRLDSLQTQIDQNLRDLAVAQNLTAIAVEVANRTEQDSLSAEAEFEALQAEAQAKYEQSVEDLEDAQDIQNRTIALQRLTQDQLLQVENLERIRLALFMEQEEIRADIGRVANELQTLDQNIRVHIARNTACLDTGILSKKKRRRRNIKSQD